MKKAGEILKGVLRDIGIIDSYREEEVCSLWAKVTKEDIAKETKALSFKKGILRVGVDNPSLRNELTFMKEKFLERFRKFGVSSIRDIRFVRERGGRK